MNELKDRNKKIRLFLLALMGVAVVCVLQYFDHAINAQDTTIFAFSYKYGFISRGLLGTVWGLADKVLPFSIMNFKAIYGFTGFVTFFFFVVLFFWYYGCMKKCKPSHIGVMQNLIVLLSMFSFPMFVTEENFGRLDVYLMIFTILCCILLVEEKAEWLIVPVCIVCVLLHQGFVFMNVNIVLVLLVYKIVMKKGRTRRKYIAIFLCTFLSISIFFLYFEFFSHMQGAEIYDEVVKLAKSLSQDGKSFAESLVNHEILGKDVFGDEYIYHLINYIQAPMFVVLYLPYLIIFVLFFRRLLRGQKGGQRLAYLAVLFGAVTLLPEIILKVDYGRYVYAGIFYYMGTVLCLMAMGDEHVSGQMEELKEEIKSKVPAAGVLLMYPLVLMPFGDLHIFEKVWKIVENHPFWTQIWQNEALRSTIMRLFGQ